MRPTIPQRHEVFWCKLDCQEVELPGKLTVHGFIKGSQETAWPFGFSFHIPAYIYAG